MKTELSTFRYVLTAAIVCSVLHCVTAAESNGPPSTELLRVGSANPRYFVDPSGRPVYLTGSHTWQSLQDGILAGYTTVAQPFDER